jgi:hypothetical protein
MGNGPAGEPHRMRRGADKVNPIQQVKLALLRIRLVYPPFVPTSSADQPFQITERPAAEMNFLVKAAGKPYPGQTDEHGFLQVLLPADVESANLTLFVKGTQQIFWQMDLVIGDLDGCQGLVGAKARLNNLGLCASETLNLAADFLEVFHEDNDLHNQYTRALYRFDRLFGGAITKNPNYAFDEKAAWARIKEVHGG